MGKISAEIIKRVKTQADRIKGLGAVNNISGLYDYDYYIVAFSGGKDSTACILHLFELGINREKIELWHHLIDGEEGSSLMDWPVTKDYCNKFAKAFDLPLYYSWKTGGFEGEMLRDNQPTSTTRFEYPEDNVIECGLTGGSGPLGTRLKFPQVSADLSIRWCSAYLKIDVCTAGINNQERFHNKKTLLITGERAEESAARAHYKEFEVHRSDKREGIKKRHVDQWRPVHKWKEAQIWDIIKKYNVRPHPAYVMGWGRLSCMKCIFGSDNQWATISAIDNVGLQKLIDYEKQFGVTIHRKYSIPERVLMGKEYNQEYRKHGVLQESLSKKYSSSIFMVPWQLPQGAFGETNGPI